MSAIPHKSPLISMYTWWNKQGRHPIPPRSKLREHQKKVFRLQQETVSQPDCVQEMLGLEDRISTPRRPLSMLRNLVEPKVGHPTEGEKDCD